jgi:hypothetical protein
LAQNELAGALSPLFKREWTSGRTHIECGSDCTVDRTGVSNVASATGARGRKNHSPHSFVAHGLCQVIEAADVEVVHCEHCMGEAAAVDSDVAECIVQ